MCIVLCSDDSVDSLPLFPIPLLNLTQRNQFKHALNCYYYYYSYNYYFDYYQQCKIYIIKKFIRFLTSHSPPTPSGFVGSNRKVDNEFSSLHKIFAVSKSPFFLASRNKTSKKK